MKISITRALTELKTLRAKIEKSIDSQTPVAVKHGTKLRQPHSHIKESDFIDEAKSAQQSLESLIARYSKIKSEIDKSNSTTVVTICGKEMTVQEAIAMKLVIPMKERLMYHLKREAHKARQEYDQALEENKKRLEKIVADSGNTGKKVQDLEEDSLAAINKLYEVSLIDPTRLDSRIEALEAEISDFNGNIDYALSESNATTFIEIPD